MSGNSSAQVREPSELAINAIEKNQLFHLTTITSQLFGKNLLA